MAQKRSGDIPIARHKVADTFGSDVAQRLDDAVLRVLRTVIERAKGGAQKPYREQHFESDWAAAEAALRKLLPEPLVDLKRVCDARTWLDDLKVVFERLLTIIQN
jgi:hypothetical protein